MIAHLHTHTHYSILDGAMTVDEMLQKAKERKIYAVAITEHGNIFSAIEFFLKAREYGIKPILGCEMYIAGDLTVKKKGEERNHLTVIVKNERGYKNLCQLLTVANVEGYYRKPRVDFSTLTEFSDGLIILSGCLQGEIPSLILSGRIDDAMEKCISYKELFKDDFYLEVQRNGLKEQEIVNNYLIEFSKKVGIKVVGTGDCHYADPDGWKTQDILWCILMNAKENDPNRKRYKTHELWIKSEEEMIKAFKDIPFALESHREIIKKCEFDMKFGREIKLPSPYDGDPDEILRKKAYEGLKKKLSADVETDIERIYDRLEYELDVIKQKKFSNYFLIVHDFINFAREKGIPVGPGRGSAAGSIVAWVLGITQFNPIKYNLIFERFLNPEREKLPDIDVDFCKERRDEVIEYIYEKYGSSKVAHVITFGTFGIKAAVRDSARIKGLSQEDISFISDAIETYENLESIPQDIREKYAEVFEYAKRIEGLIRQAGSHASGFVISDKPLTEYMPLSRAKNGDITTQFEMNSLEKIGLVKFDFLGLETLTVIDKTLKMIKERRGIELDFYNIPLDDKKVYEMFSEGDTFGVFQFESPGMREMLRKMKPEKFGELVAAVALYRPGPLQSGMVDEFIRRKKEGKIIIIDEDFEKEIRVLSGDWNEKIKRLESILEETYGVLIYQEQIMFLSSILANFSMAEADILREAMGKKKGELMEKMRDKFVEGAVRSGLKRETAERIFLIMDKFSGYAFNKAHSVSYAYISYITQYLKAHFKLEYFSSLLTSEMENHEKLVNYIKTMKDYGVEIKPPSILKSDVEFKVEDNGIRFGLGGIKGIGKVGASELVNLREKVGISSIRDFIIKAGNINKRYVEAIIKAGALDELGEREKAYEALMRTGKLFEKKIYTWDDFLEEEERVLGIALSTPPQIKKLSTYPPPIKLNGITEFFGILKDIIPLKENYLSTIIARTENGEKGISAIIEKKNLNVKEWKIYIFIGKVEGERAIIKEIFEENEDLSAIFIPGTRKSLEEISEKIRSMEDGNISVFIYTGKLLKYRRKVDFRKAWELGAMGAIFVPTSYLPLLQQQNLQL